MSEAQQSGRVWFITGASSGFGRAMVEEALRRGQRVVAAVRQPDQAKELSGRPDVLVVRLDVTKSSDIQDGIGAAVDRFGAVDVLVNNAGFSIVGAVEETDPASLRDTMDTMFFGPVALTRAVLPAMRARRSGTIVQISSMGGLTTAPGFGAYCAAKHALEGLSECLAQELAPFGVRVLIVEPGAFRTELFGPRFRRMPPIDAYAPTVGPIRDYAAQNNGVQPGDPDKAAAAIADAVSSPAPPLRLPLGVDAVEAIRQKMARVLADVDATEKVARSTGWSPS